MAGSLPTNPTMTGASRGLMGGQRRGLRGKATSRAPHGYVHPSGTCQKGQAAKTAGLDGGGGQRRAGVDGITKTRRDRPDSTTRRGHGQAAIRRQATGQA